MLHDMSIVATIDAGPCHCRDVRSLSAKQCTAARLAALSGYVRLESARGRWATRYVVTAAGSHALGTFRDARDIDHEIAMARMRRAS
jgi:hypothetical protein